MIIMVAFNYSNLKMKRLGILRKLLTHTTLQHLTKRTRKCNTWQVHLSQGKGFSTCLWTRACRTRASTFSLRKIWIRLHNSDLHISTLLPEATVPQVKTSLTEFMFSQVVVKLKKVSLIKQMKNKTSLPRVSLVISPSTTSMIPADAAEALSPHRWVRRIFTASKTYMRYKITTKMTSFCLYIMRIIIIRPLINT